MHGSCQKKICAYLIENIAIIWQGISQNYDIGEE